MFEVFEVFAHLLEVFAHTTFAAQCSLQIYMTGRKEKSKIVLPKINIYLYTDILMHSAITSLSIKQLSVEVHVVKMGQGHSFEDKVEPRVKMSEKDGFRDSGGFWKPKKGWPSEI